MIARSQAGARTIPARDFFVGPLENSLQTGEWVAETRWPVRAAGAGYAFEEFARRSGDYALCGVAAVATRAKEGRFAATLTYLGMGDVPARLETEAIAVSDVDDAVASLTDSFDPIADVHASRDFRMQLARTLGRRAVCRAAEAMDGS